MHTRIVQLTLKPNASPEFSRVLQEKILPALRNEPGFQDELVFVVLGGPEVTAISIWDSSEDADNYARTAYPAVLKTIGHLLEGEPEVGSYQLALSTLHDKGLAQYPHQSPNTTPSAGVGGG